MKKLFITLTIASLVFTSCSKDDDGGKKEDCFNCTEMGVTIKYCYTEGNDFYTVTFAGQTVEQPLNGESWSDIKEDLQELCD